MSLQNKIASGVRWGLLSRVVTQVSQLGITIFMSRLLSPGDYGLVAMITIFIGFSSVLLEVGLGSAIVYKQDIHQRQISTIFWINILLGATFSLLFFFTAGLMASFYGESRLEGIVEVFSIIFIISAVGIVPKNILTKKMILKKISIIEIVATILSGVIGVAMAMNGWGVWSLVGSQILLKLLLSILYITLAPWRPDFVLSLSGIKNLLHYGLGLTGFNVVNYWARQGDSLLIGKFLGAADLGLYNRAYSLMLLPISQITSVTGQVMFPALSSINTDYQKVKHLYLRMQNWIVFLSFPMMLGLFSMADIFTVTVFGKQWVDMIPVFKVLCLVSLVQVIGNPTGLLFSAMGKTGLQFRLGIINSMVMIAFIGLGVYLGEIEFVAWGYLVANVLITPVLILKGGKEISLGLKDIWRSISGVLAAAVFMAGCVHFFVLFLENALPDVWLLIAGIGFGMTVYVLLVSGFKIEPYSEVKKMINQKLGINS